MDKYIEQRFVEGIEHDERTLVGRMPYGEVAAVGVPVQFHETIRPGAFGAIGDVILNTLHSRTIPLARTGGGGLEIEDTDKALTFRAVLPRTSAADDALELVRAGVMRGISIEMRVKHQNVAAGPQGRVRVVERAELVGIALADRPVYQETSIGARFMATIECTGPLDRLPWIDAGSRTGR